MNKIEFKKFKNQFSKKEQKFIIFKNYKNTSFKNANLENDNWQNINDALAK